MQNVARFLHVSHIFLSKFLSRPFKRILNLYNITIRSFHRRFQSQESSQTELITPNFKCLRIIKLKNRRRGALGLISPKQQTFCRFLNIASFNDKFLQFCFPCSLHPVRCFTCTKLSSPFPKIGISYYVSPFPRVQWRVYVGIQCHPSHCFPGRTLDIGGCVHAQILHRVRLGKNADFSGRGKC